MPADPNNPGAAQCQAIGALTYDSAVAVNMGFSKSGSGANIVGPAWALLQTFMYSNAIFGSASNASDFDPSLVSMVNANLDARLPVCVALNGHQVVGDGYGYSLSTLYNHLNMGWGGEGNVWYALPDVTDTLTNVWGFIYNIYTNGSGEIVSGRVMSGAVPVANAKVTAIRAGGGTFTATTDTNGIYALVAIPSASQYSISVNVTNLIPAFTNCSTGTSFAGGTSSGDVSGADFALVAGAGPPLIEIEPESQFINEAYPPAAFTITALSQSPLNYQWQLQASGSSNWTNVTNGASYSGSQSQTLVLNVLSVSQNGFQFRCIVTNSSGCVTSGVAFLNVGGFSPDCVMPAPTGLVSWWSGDATANNIAGTNNGTLENGATYARGEVGYAFDFNGTNQCVDVANIPVPSPLFSVSAWIYPAAFAQPGNEGALGGTIIDENEWGGVTGWILGVNSSGGLWFWPSSSNDRYSSATIPLNTWTCIFVTYDGANINFYINGVLDSSHATPTPQGSPSLFKIGSKSWIAGYWSGRLDEVQMYNRAISASEIHAIYLAGTNGMCAPSPYHRVFRACRATKI